MEFLTLIEASENQKQTNDIDSYSYTEIYNDKNETEEIQNNKETSEITELSKFFIKFKKINKSTRKHKNFK